MKSDKKLFGKVSRYLLSDSEIGMNEITLLAYFSSLSFDKGHCWPSRSRIKDDLGIGDRVLNKSLAVLKNLGYIERRKAIKKERIVYLTSLKEPSTAMGKETDAKLDRYKGLLRFGYGTVYYNVLSSESLSFGAKGVYTYLSIRMGSSGFAKPNRKKAVKDLKISDRTYSRYLNELIKNGIISEIKDRKAGKYLTRWYCQPQMESQTRRKYYEGHFLFSNSTRQNNTSQNVTRQKATDNKKEPFPQDKPFSPSSALQTLSVQEEAKRTEVKKQATENPYSYEALYEKEKAEIQKSVIKYGYSADTAIPASDIIDSMMSSISCLVESQKMIPDTITKDNRVLRLAFQHLTGYQTLDNQPDQLRCDLAHNIEDALVSMCVDERPRKYANGLYATGSEVITLLNKKLWASDTTPTTVFKGLLDHIYTKTSSKVITSLTGYLRSCIWCYLNESKVVALSRHNAEQYLRRAATGEYNEPGEETHLSERDQDALDWFLRATNPEEIEDYAMAMQA